MEVMMKHKARLMLAFIASCLCSSQLALAEVPDCDKLSTPKNIEGQVIKIEQGKVSVRTADGTIHEFQASQETL